MASRSIRHKSVKWILAVICLFCFTRNPLAECLQGNQFIIRHDHTDVFDIPDLTEIHDPIDGATSDVPEMSTEYEPNVILGVDISGTWKGEVLFGRRSAPVTFYLTQKGQDVTGRWESPGFYATKCGLWSGDVIGDVAAEIFSFTAESPMKDLDTCGVICLDEIVGTITVQVDRMQGPASETDCQDGSVYHLKYDLQREPQPNISVQITGGVETWVYNPSNPATKDMHNPRLKLKAVGTPEGGTYTWEIVRGAERATLGAINGSEATVIGQAPSESPGDVEIGVRYMVNSQECTDTHRITVQKATYLCQRGKPVDNPNHPQHDYETLYTYEVRDQFNNRLVPRQTGNTKQLVTEKVTYISTNHPIKCPIPIPPYVRVSYFDETGVVKDSLAFDCLASFPNPDDLIAKANQRIWVGGWEVSRRTLTFYNNRARSREIWNPCSNP